MSNVVAVAEGWELVVISTSLAGDWVIVTGVRRWAVMKLS
jgi:hypothetical protein